MPCAVMTKVVGLVLAGGNSRRMGRDKAALEVAGVSLLNMARKPLSAAGCQQILVSGAGGLVDRYPNAGPLAGLDAAIMGLSDGTLLLVVPVDMPHITADLLTQLTDECAGQPGVYFAKQPFPCCLRVTAQLRDAVQQALTMTSADRSLFGLFQRLGFVELVMKPAHVAQFFNCNTPEEFASLVSLASLGGKP